MKKMDLKKKVSAIATVLNEERNVRDFIDSIIMQTKKPDEFMVIDGGSNDATYKILKEYSKKHRWIKTYQLKGANISQGRNFAIKKTRNEIILGVDAGTKYEKNWIEEMVKAFSCDVGFGRTLPLIENEFQKVLAKQMKQKYGSSRNIILKKSVWANIGGYPEDLDIGEDTFFNEKIKRKGFVTQKISEAIGYWEMRKNLEEVKKQFFRYGYWDGYAYRKYKILPLKNKIAVIGLAILLPLYPFFWLISGISLELKIKIARRFNYIVGFLRGYINLKGRK